jgi:hypothetical protein
MAPVVGLAAKAPNRLLVQSGSAFLMRLHPNSPSRTTIKEVNNDKLDEEMAISWRVHGTKIYRAGLESCEAGHGRAGFDTGCQNADDNRIGEVAMRRRVKNGCIGYQYCFSRFSLLTLSELAATRHIDSSNHSSHPLANRQRSGAALQTKGCPVAVSTLQKPLCFTGVVLSHTITIMTSRS